MIDEDDADFAALASVATPGWGGLLLLLLAVLLYWVAASNRTDCIEHTHCAEGMKPKVVDNECVCVGAPQ